MYTDFQKKWIKENCSKTSIGKLVTPLFGWAIAIALIALHVYKINNDVISKTFSNIIDYSSYFYTIFNVIACSIMILNCLVVVFVLLKIIDNNDNEIYFTYIKAYKDACYNFKYEKIIQFMGIVLSCLVQLQCCLY